MAMTELTPRLSATNAEDSSNDNLLQRFKSWLRYNLRGKAHDSSLKEALEEVLEEHEEESTLPATEEQAMIRNVITFADKAVHEIMTPRSEIKAVEYGVTLPELKEHISQHIHTRIPVYNDTMDNMKGFIHVKDLLPHLSNDTPFNMALILRDLMFVPPSMRLINLLVKMRDAGVHMAIVVDEYGGTDGLVTLEDLFEEIVGDIQDEHDQEEQDSTLNWSSSHTCDVEATTCIEDIDKALHLSLLPEAEENEYDTLGGLIFFRLGRVPEKGEKLDITDGITCEIISADPRRIHKVKLTRIQP